MRIAVLLHKSVEFDSRVRRESGTLAAMGHEVIVLELASDRAADENLDGFVRRSCLPSPAIRRLPFRLYRIAFMLKFVKEIAALRPDVVHAHDVAMLLPGVVGARLVGAQLVYDAHELATSVPYRERVWARLVAVIERVVITRCSAVITVSDGIAARLRDRYALRVTPSVVRNVSALEAGGTGGLRRRLGLGADALLVLHQGAPAPGRGCEVLLDALTRLPDVHLAFLGDPETGYGEQLEASIRERRLQARVSTLPSVPLSRLLANTAEADVGVTLLQDTCENHRLALPNKLFEYIAAGVPVIASALPEMQKLVGAYGIGWCVAPDDPAQVAAAIEHALASRADPELRQRLRRASEALSWELEQRVLIELYEELARGRSCRPARAPA